MAQAQAISGIIQAGVDTGVLVNDIISSIYQMQAAEKSEQRAYGLAQQQRQDVLAQQKIDNWYKQVGVDLSKQNLSFERMKWGQTFKMTRQQYADQKAALAQQMTRQRTLDVMGGVESQLAAQNQQYNQAIGRMGV
jgi:hypothetical protein